MADTGSEGFVFSNFLSDLASYAAKKNLDTFVYMYYIYIAVNSVHKLVDAVLFGIENLYEASSNFSFVPIVTQMKLGDWPVVTQQMPLVTQLCH